MCLSARVSFRVLQRYKAQFGVLAASRDGEHIDPYAAGRRGRVNAPPPPPKVAAWWEQPAVLKSIVRSSVEAKAAGGAPDSETSAGEEGESSANGSREVRRSSADLF